MLRHYFSEQKIHQIFDFSILLKGIHAGFEIVVGVALFFISEQWIISTLYSFTQDELREDPRDFLATSILNSAQHLTVGGQIFAAWYLLSHGIVKLILVMNLYKEKLWAYPLSIFVFSLFVVYQMYRFLLTHSPSLVLLTVLDLVVIGLTWHEYRVRKGWSVEKSGFFTEN